MSSFSENRTRLISKVLKKVDRARLKLGLDKDHMESEDSWIDLGEARARFASEGNDGDLANIFFENHGRVIDKWLHYLPVYERYLARYRGTDFKMLEIGVFKGGSLDMWRKYFGDKATIFGVDINPDCAGYASPPNQVRIGSQGDPAFLRGVAAEMGRIDVVLDDGSHIAQHQRVSFETLFPLLVDGGLYIIEDMHTAYWPYCRFGTHMEGGYRREGTAVELAKGLVDDLHHWYHGRGPSLPANDAVAAVHFHDSVVVIEKRSPSRPVRLRTGEDETKSALSTTPLG